MREDRVKGDRERERAEKRERYDMSSPLQW